MCRYLINIFLLYTILTTSGISQGANQFLGAKEKRQYLESMQQKLAPLKQLKANFAQTRKISAFKDELISHGIFYFKFPSQLRWEITKPIKSLIIFNENIAKKYRFKDGSWSPRDFAGAEFMKIVMEDILSWTKGNFNKTSETYDLKVSKQNEIILTPKSTKTTTFISAIELTVDPKTKYIKKVLIKDPGNDHVTIQFNSFSHKEFSDKLLFKEPNK